MNERDLPLAEQGDEDNRPIDPDETLDPDAFYRLCDVTISVDPEASQTIVFDAESFAREHGLHVGQSSEGQLCIVDPDNSLIFHDVPTHPGMARDFLLELAEKKRNSLLHLQRQAAESIQDAMQGYGQEETIEPLDSFSSLDRSHSSDETWHTTAKSDREAHLSDAASTLDVKLQPIFEAAIMEMTTPRQYTDRDGNTIVANCLHEGLKGFRSIKQLGKGGMGETYLITPEYVEGATPLVRLPDRLLCKHIHSQSFNNRFSANRRPLFEGSSIVSGVESDPDIDKSDLVVEIATCASAGQDVYWSSDAESAFFCEYIEGDTLSDFCHSNGIQPYSSEQCRLMETIARELLAQHRDANFHEDVKDGNIIVNSVDEARFIDWGLSVYAGDVDERWGGTPNYMCPEFAACSNRADPACPSAASRDTFALGVEFYKLCSGRRFVPDFRILSDVLNYLKEFDYDEDLSARMTEGRVPVDFQPLLKHLLGPDEERSLQQFIDAIGTYRHRNGMGRVFCHPPYASGELVGQASCLSDQQKAELACKAIDTLSQKPTLDSFTLQDIFLDAERGTVKCTASEYVAPEKGMHIRRPIMTAPESFVEHGHDRGANAFNLGMCLFEFFQNLPSYSHADNPVQGRHFVEIASRVLGIPIDGPLVIPDIHKKIAEQPQVLEKIFEEAGIAESLRGIVRPLIAFRPHERSFDEAREIAEDIVHGIFVPDDYRTNGLQHDLKLIELRAVNSGKFGPTNYRFCHAAALRFASFSSSNASVNLPEDTKEHLYSIELVPDNTDSDFPYPDPSQTQCDALHDICVQLKRSAAHISL